MSSILDNPDHPCVSTGSGETEAYIVEVRLKRNCIIPRHVGRQLITSEWTRLDPSKVEKGLGVPNGHGSKSYALAMSDLLDYPTAEAIRWWAVAEAKAQYFDLETRLVRHKLSWSWRSEPVDAVKTVDAYDLMFPNATPEQKEGIPNPKEVTLSDIDLLNILKQRKDEHVRKQEYAKGAEWREVEKALMTAAGINKETPQDP